MRELFNCSIREIVSGKLCDSLASKDPCEIEELLYKYDYSSHFLTMNANFVALSPGDNATVPSATAKEAESQAEDDGSSSSCNFASKTLTFGKYAGQTLGSVPASYLKWITQHARVMKEENRKFALFAKVMRETKGE